MGTACLVLLALLAGCGNDKKDTKPAPRTVIAALGDSITAGSPLWDPNSGVRAQLGDSLNPQSQYEYWAARRLERVRFRNCGVFGERTDEIARRFASCARGAKFLILQGGINDIAQAVPVERAAKNLEGVVRRAQRRRMRVALVEVLPWNNGHPGADVPIRRLNALIHRLARRRHVPVYPWYRALEDPRRPGTMRRDLTIDGDHPSVAGYRRLAATVPLPLP